MLSRPLKREKGGISRTLLLGVLLLAAPPTALALPSVDLLLENKADDFANDSIFFDSHVAFDAIDENLSSEGGGNSASVALQVSEANREVAISISHTRSDVHDSSVTSEIHIRFVSDMQYSYALSGQYAELVPSFEWLGAVFSFSYASPPGNPGDGRGPPVTLFSQSQVSYWDLTEELLLGSVDRRYSHNVLEGAIQGAIPAGVEVSFYLQIGLLNHLPGSPGTSASGEYVLTLTPVPEPGTPVMIGLGLAALGRRQICVQLQSNGS